MPEEDFVEVRFRLYDGTDIGPFRYSPNSTVAMLKERVVTEWPKDKKIVPKAANDVKLISGGKILENNKTVGQCKTPFGELQNGVVTMHAVVQPSIVKTKTEEGRQGSQAKHVFMFNIVKQDGFGNYHVRSGSYTCRIKIRDIGKEYK
ncbi:Membrane-anchored ubiquitin-fold protein 3 [Castilleja foliolosa]|uniref:Membrane-anchored ubiquitin-fold protein 3 n=1 Tax=Castilleja foliolosa TaxID=1961234 RepID=A0ABD3DP78_9LAMI